MGAVIEIKNLSFAYEDVTEQLKNINLTVNEGEIVVLTGPSGGGKSTLTRVINGLVPYFYEGTLTGEVLLMGKNLKDIPSWERGRYIGNVFQDPRSQFFANEVAGEIAFGCENYGFSHEQIMSQVENTAQELAIEPVPQRGKLVIFPRCVYTVVNGNVAHFVFGENNLYQFAGFQIITSQTGKVFCYDGRHVPGFNLMQHGLKPLTLKAHAGKSVVYEKARVEKVVFVSIFL